MIISGKETPQLADCRKAREESTLYRTFWLFLAATVVTIILVASIIWARAHPFGVHWDEAEYLNQVGIDAQRLWAGKLLSLGGRILIKSFGRPPAYRILVLPFLAIFGFHVLVARLVSLGCFALSGWFVYLATRRVAGSAAGAFAVLVFALSPEVISASSFFGTDTSLYLATSATLYYVFTAWNGGSNEPKNWIGLGLAVGLGFLAKTSFFAIAIPVFGFWLTAGHYGWLEVPSITTQKKAGVLSLFIAAPWWILNLKTSIEYARYARGFVRNSLGTPSPGTWMRWLSTVIEGLVGHGLAVLIILVFVTYFVRVSTKKEMPFGPLQRAVIIACVCAGLPIVLAQLSGTNHLLRHISPAMIPLAISVALLAEKSGWTSSWSGTATASALFCGQLVMVLTPVAFPNSHTVDLAFPNSALPWQALVRFDQWDWTPAESLSRSCGLDAPKISYLGNGRAFDIPQIQYFWIVKRQAQPEVTWLWRYEDGPLDWQKVMYTADQNDIVITAPGFVGEAKIKEDLDNQHNAEFADRLSRDPHFRAPIRLGMGRFEPVEVLVFVKSTLVCHPESSVLTQP
jgi:4-amino-4-deoxy-L-arabinose transferase-like glycosyltransferase